MNLLKKMKLIPFQEKNFVNKFLIYKKRLTLIHDFIESLIDKIDEKEALLNEIHQLTDI